jgi:two-component system response regulator YesN
MKKQKTFYKIFISYLIILIVPMSILGGVNYYNSLRVVERNIEKDTIAGLTQGAYMIDSRTEEINRLANELSVDKRVMNLVNTNPRDEFERIELAVNVRNGLLSYTILNDFIEEVFIYSKYSDNLISSGALYSSYMFYDGIYSIKGMEYNEFLKYIGEECYNKLDLKTIVQKNNKSTEKVIFRQALPGITDSLGTVIIIIGKEKYLNIISSAMKWENSYYYVYDKQNNLITSNDQKSINLYSVSANLSDDFKSKTINTPEGKALQIKVTSSYNNWKYVAVIPYKEFTAQIDTVKENTLLIIGICILIGFIISYLAANNNYRNIKDIVTFIKSTYGSNDEEVDDYSLITKILKSSYKEINTNRNLLEEQLPLIKESYINKLLFESEELEYENNNSNHILNINLEFEKYRVVLFRINNEESKVDASKNALDKFAIRAVVQEIFNEKISGYITEAEQNTIAYICSFNNESEESIESLLITTVTNALIFIKEKIHISAACGVGSTYYGYNNISKSYEEAVEALNYGIFNHQDLIFYRDIRRSSNVFAYSIQKEGQLINYIKNGKKSQALSIVDSLYKDNCENSILSYEMMKFFMFDLYCSIVKLLGEIKINNDNPVFDIIESFNDQRFNGRDVLCILEDIKNLISMICDTLDEQRSQNVSGLKEKVLNYIDENYTNSQISLEVIADNFNINSQYLSRFFKENIGVNYVNYINEKRINKAIEHLKNSEKVKDAAVKSGFDNIGTFINVFKKHMGITPGEYKEKLGG